MKINAHAALAAKQPLSSFSYEAKPLSAWEVRIQVTHCGICHSDVHLVDNDWQLNNFPVVPGHEIVGLVTDLGSNVKHLKIGERVGIGWQCGSCMHCEWCESGEVNLCGHQTATCSGHFGGFADYVQADSRFAVPIPDKLSSAEVAPLFCGGATVYSPLRRYIHSSTQKVGVIGIGGLGHLAVQFANAFGCEVTAFSSNSNKREEVKKLGAHHVINSTDTNELKKVINSLDLIISTVMVPLDWETYLSILRPKGVLCFVGANPEPIRVGIFSLIRGRKTICGSNIASIEEIKEMLQLAADKNIKAYVENMPMNQANVALDKVRNNKAHYRVVLSNDI